MGRNRIDIIQTFLVINITEKKIEDHAEACKWVTGKAIFRVGMPR